MSELVRATRRVVATVAGLVLDRWIRITISRSLGEISGSFVLELRDDVRNLATWLYASFGSIGPLVIGQRIVITIDGETVLVGWVEDVQADAGDGEVRLAIAGRDITGDLVDCAAAPEGPVEYFKLTCAQLGERLVQPFGLSCRCDVDPGEPFDKCSIDAAETVVSVLEKHARQRKLLVTSDGVEGLVLTRSGQEPAAGPIVFPGRGVMRSSGTFAARDRFSHYFVKGQAEKAGGARARSAPMTPGTTPGGRTDGAAAAHRARNGGGNITDSGGRRGGGRVRSAERGGVENHGLALDPEITRWRPIVAMMKSQESAGGAQQQAEWMTAVHKARGINLAYTVADWRGASGALWRPNTIARVRDRYQQVDEDLLIDAVDLIYGEEGAVAELRLVGPEAYSEEGA